MISALAFGYFALAGRGPFYSLVWHTKTGATARYYVHAKSASEGRSLVADAFITAKVAAVQEGAVQKLLIGATDFVIKTAVETDSLPNVNGVEFDVDDPSNDLRKLGMLANIPGFIFVPISSKPVSKGQTWARAMGGRFKFDSVSKIDLVPVVCVTLSPDTARLDSMDGKFWFSTTDGAMVRAQIHTKRDPGVEQSQMAVEWDIFIDRRDNAKKK